MKRKNVAGAVSVFGIIVSLNAHADCPKVSTNPISKSDAIQLMTKAYSSSTLGECQDAVVDAVDANATETSAEQSGMTVTTPGIRTTTIYRCSATADDGKKLVIYAKVEKFEPTSWGRSDGFSMALGKTCKVPDGVFYRVTNSYRVVQ